MQVFGGDNNDDGTCHELVNKKGFLYLFYRYPIVIFTFCTQLKYGFFFIRPQRKQRHKMALQNNNMMRARCHSQVEDPRQTESESRKEKQQRQ